MNVSIPCLCPPRGTGEVRHPDGDTVVLQDPLDFRKMVTVRKAIVWMRQEDPEASVPEILGMLTEAYLLHCIDSWTLVDDKGRPVPPSKAEIRARLLPTEAAMVIGDAADELYTERVVLPLLVPASNSSRPSPTAGSTSASNGTHPKPSKPSSISTTPMAGTEATP